jgi:hypothetical protein
MDSAITRIKMLCNWCSSETLCRDWSSMNGGKCRWNNIEITWENENIDYYIIVNKPHQGEHYDPARTLIFQMEPWIYDENKHWGVKTWGEWASPDPAKFAKVFAHKTFLNNVQWHVDYPFYTTPVKTGEERQNKIATISSEKDYDTGHILRNKFIKFAEEHNANTNDNMIDIYGRQNYHGFRGYKSTVPDENKYNVFSSYKYCITAENNSEHNYATEKIWEAILCESLCFYWGCPNLEDYIDSRAFVRLPLEDPAAAFQIIQQAVEEDWWSARIGIIKETKEKVLTQLAFFPSLERTLRELNCVPKQ